MTLIHDHHIHTVYSGHSAPDMTVQHAIRQAEVIGLKRMIILEHVPEVTGGRVPGAGEVSESMLRDPIMRIDKEVRACRRDSSVRVLVGAEIDADPTHRDGRLLLTNLNNIDIVIASTHFLPNHAEPWYNVQGVMADDRLHALRAEWFAWTQRVAANPAVDILAHPGVEMTSIGAIQSFEGEVLEEFEQLLRVCAKHKTAFELNETVARKIGPLPARTYENVVALARDLGVKISIGSDAHRLPAIGQYDFVTSLVQRLGLTHNHFLHPVSRR